MISTRKRKEWKSYVYIFGISSVFWIGSAFVVSSNVNILLWNSTVWRTTSTCKQVGLLCTLGDDRLRVTSLLWECLFVVVVFLNPLRVRLFLVVGGFAFVYIEETDTTRKRRNVVSRVLVQSLCLKRSSLSVYRLTPGDEAFQQLNSLWCSLLSPL